MPRGQGGGPKTPEGKARSSRNALKHAIMSPHPVVIKGLETVEAWDAFQTGIIESWEPVGGYERELTEIIACQLWRRRRCRYFETMVLNKQVEETEEELQSSDAWEDDLPDGAPWPEIEPDRLLENQLLKLMPDRESLDTILRWETHVSKLLFQAVHELEVRQAHRRGERLPVARVDFNSSSALPIRRPAGTGEVSALREINKGLTMRNLIATNRAPSP